MRVDFAQFQRTQWVGYTMQSSRLHEVSAFQGWLVRVRGEQRSFDQSVQDGLNAAL